LGQYGALEPPWDEKKKFKYSETVGKIQYSSSQEEILESLDYKDNHEPKNVLPESDGNGSVHGTAMFYSVGDQEHFK
jgi:hypothetical protein